MKKVLRNSIFVLAAALAMMQFGDNSITKDTHFIEEASSIQSVGAQSVKKLIGSDEKVAYSKIYTQYAELENNYVLRFAVAVKGDINSLTFTRASLEGHAEKVKEVPTVYRGIIANDTTYFYDGLDLTTDESKAGIYYWACYTISYGKSSTLKDTPIDLSLSINGESKASIKKSLQYVIDYKAVEDITLSNINLYNNEIVFDLNKGTTSQNLNATAAPVDATEADNITYEIENKEIATVDDKGNITPVSVGKTTLTIKCDEVTKVVTIRVVNLDDSSLINDADKAKFTAIKDSDYNTPGWYVKQSYASCPVSMANNVVTYTIGKKINASPAIQIFYLPKSDLDSNSVYVGKYLFSFTATNNSNAKTIIKCNLNNVPSIITQSLSLEIGETQTYTFAFNSTSIKECLNIKVMETGSAGNITLNNIHFIALVD